MNIVLYNKQHHHQDTKFTLQVSQVFQLIKKG